jgi:hypothetical protein
MKQRTMYPTHDEVIDATKFWSSMHCPEWELVDIHGVGDSLRSFNALFDREGDVLSVSFKIMPNHSSQGWHVREDRLIYVGTPKSDWPRKIEPYPQYLRDLMEADDQAAIVSLDNEEDAYPEGHPVFGYALLDEARNIIAFVQHLTDDPDQRRWTFNPFLPHGVIVTDPVILQTLMETEGEHIRTNWIDDEKEWWA